MKRVIAVIIPVFLISAVSLFSPQLATSYEEIDNCKVCHSSDEAHVIATHLEAGCEACHSVHSGGGVINFLMPVPATCVACHPSGSPGKCGLVGTHGSECLACHGVECSDITTTTSVPVEHGDGGKVNETLCLTCHELGSFSAGDGSIHGEHSDCDQCHEGGRRRGTVDADKCIVCHPSGNAGMCNLVGGHGNDCLACHSVDCPDISTTTSVPVEHGDGGKVNETLCLTCHELGAFSAGDGSLHGEHNDCDQCHEGGRRRGTVDADKCIVCHPSGNAGMCNLVGDHGNDCLACHNVDCPDITTTTTVPIEHEVGGMVNEALCLPCHEIGSVNGAPAGTLHGDHSDCDQCHVGGKKRGTVTADKCMVCHPSGNAGMCNLAANHGSDCLGCHRYECSDITTTTSVPRGHGSNGGVNEHACLRCHELPDNISPYDAPSGTLHGDHSDCDQCHVGGKSRGTVIADKCVVCHPSENPGECSLANLHGSSCLTCHSDCVDGTNTHYTYQHTPLPWLVHLHDIAYTYHVYRVESHPLHRK